MRMAALAASPRKGGNSDLVLDAFLAGAAAGKAKTRKIYLNDLKVRACQACYACKKTGKCKQKDDMKKVYKRLLKAEVWVFATPIYWWGPAAQLKLVIDRLFPFCHAGNPKKLKGKKFVLITTSEDGPKLAAPHVVGMMKQSMAYLEMEWSGEFLVQAGKKGEVKKNKEVLKAARELGKKLAGGK